MWVHTVLAFSNVFGVPAVVAALSRNHYGNAFVVVGAMVASFLMHLSETKHSLDPGQLLAPLSRSFLNFDRAYTVAAIFWFLPQWASSDHGWWPSLLILAVGWAALRLGELTSHLATY